MARDETTGQLPEATVSRLPIYLQVLTTQASAGVENISSEGLAELAGVNAAKVRKDLSYLGSYGTRGVGYTVEHLISQIGHELGLDEDWPVMIIGAGNLGQALAGYAGFENRGFRVVAVVDVDRDKVGTRLGDLEVEALDRIGGIVAEFEISIGVIATPPDAATDAAQRLVDAGVTSILNFAPVVLSVPDHVGVRNVDLAVELQILSYHDQHRIEHQMPSLRPENGDPEPVNKPVNEPVNGSVVNGSAINIGAAASERPISGALLRPASDPADIGQQALG